MGDNEKIIKAIASRVNKTLNYFEKDFISAQRSPEVEKERCQTLEDYIEKRFNYEAYKVPELREAIRLTEGHLFYVDELEEVNEAKRRFKKAHICVITEEMVDTTDESLKSEIAKALEYIGGSHIIFNSVKQKIKLIIENERIE